MSDLTIQHDVEKSLDNLRWRHTPPKVLMYLLDLDIRPATIAAAIHRSRSLVTMWANGQTPVPDEMQEALFDLLEHVVSLTEERIKQMKSHGAWPPEAQAYMKPRLTAAKKVLKEGSKSSKQNAA